jgi:hypothetical protein
MIHFPLKSVRSVAAICAALFGTAAVADAEYYVCAITKTDRFFPDEMVFAIDQQTGTAMVVDPIILYYNDGRGREAQITESTAKKIVFNWDMSMTNMSGQNAIMRFRGVLQRPSLRVLVTAQPSGYDSVFKGRGRCQPAEVEIEGL